MTILGETAATAARGQRAVRAWLYLLAALVVAMVAVGGATRLTGSGLSITEWRPVTGALPPLSAEAWAAEFDKYKGTPQYRILNQGMGLADFKILYGWEWGHRLLGRIVGLIFFLPLIWFWWRGYFTRRLKLGLLGLGLLGALQGAIGWIMVASGLQPGMTAVAPLKLALHLTTASLILAGLVWLAAGLRTASVEAEPARLHRTLGPSWPSFSCRSSSAALVAGSKAGLVYNTWPTMNGMLVPPASELFFVRPWIENFIDNLTLVQFNHRLTALPPARPRTRARPRRAPDEPRLGSGPAVHRVAGIVLAQAILGITTLLLGVPLWAALAHQVFAMAVLTMATVHARIGRSAPQVAVLDNPSTPFGFEDLSSGRV